MTTNTVKPTHYHLCIGGCNHPDHPVGSKCSTNNKHIHQAHSWPCYRPNCKEGRDYICGLLADARLGSARGGMSDESQKTQFKSGRKI